jgi:hypothetical protein
MHSIDVTKLTHVVKKDGKIVSRCPACAARGADVTGNNLVVFSDGKFGCQAARGDKEHNRQILALAGAEKGGSMEGCVPIRRVVHPPSTVIKIVGRLGRALPSSPPVEDAKANQIKTKAPSEMEDIAHTEARPPRPPLTSLSMVEEAPQHVPAPSGRPKVPKAILDDLKRRKTMTDGRVADACQCNADSNHDFDDSHCSESVRNGVNHAPLANPETERDLERETGELLSSQGYITLPNGAIINPHAHSVNFM